MTWRQVPLGSVCAIFDGPHATPQKTDEGPVFLGISNLNRGRIDLGETQHLSEEDFVRWTRRVTPRPGDVVFSYETRLGEAANIPGGLRCCLGRRMGLLRADRSKVEPRFLLYAYLGPNFQEVIRERTVHGSTVERILLEELGKFPVRLPPLPEQRAIAHILGTLDDKIELTRRMNETLEAMARAIFKSWFVDFDPVHAKAAGRDPGLPKHLANLFPDSFEASELGEIPKGWRVGRIGDFATLSREGIDPGEFPEETFDHFSIPAFDEGRKPKAETGEAIKSHKFLVPSAAVLLSKLNPRIPRIWLPRVLHTHRAVCSTEFLVTLPRTGISREFLYSFFSSDAFAGVFETLVTGTSGSHQRVKPEALLAMDTVISDEPVIHQFTDVVRPLMTRVNHARHESESLAAVRDTLLPKLLSGQIRIRDAEKIVQAQV